MEKIPHYVSVEVSIDWQYDIFKYKYLKKQPSVYEDQGNNIKFGIIISKLIPSFNSTPTSSSSSSYQLRTVDISKNNKLPRLKVKLLQFLWCSRHKIFTILLCDITQQAGIFGDTLWPKLLNNIFFSDITNLQAADRFVRTCRVAPDFPRVWESCN